MASSLRAPRTPVQATRSLLRNLLIAASALLLRPDEARATHAVGGELTYTCLGSNQYKVTLKFYRDCNGVAAPTNCTNGLSFNVASANCGANFDQCLTLESVQIITPICPSELDRCSNATGTYGVEEYTFSKIISLTPYANCGTGNDFVISWALCCRNNAITSLQNPGNQSLYLNTNLNRTLTPCDNSPVFLNAPTPYYCLGQPISYNPGAFDPDGDSLAYAIIQPRTAGNVNIPFTAGYTVAQPIHNTGGANAVVLNPITGTLTCVPDIQQVSVVTYRVREYRNGVLIGAVTRDVQFVVRVCTGNSSPTATGVNGTNNYTTTVCTGTPVSFTINTNDANAGQNTTIVYSGGIPGGNFTTSGSPFQTGTFTWTPTAADIGNNTFTITVNDNACPLTGTNQYGYTVIVTPPFAPANAGPDLQACGTVTMQAVLPYSQTPAQWTVISGSGTFSSVSNPNAVVTGMAQGNNVFQWTLDYAPCGITSDQVTVVNYSASQAAADAGPNQQLCTPSTSGQLAANAAVPPAVGTWTLINGTGTFADPNNPNSMVNGMSIGQNKFQWTISNGPCGAPTTDQVTIMLYDYAQPAANAGPDQLLCLPTSSTTMNAQPANGTWSVIAGTGVFVNVNFRNSAVSGLSAGVNSFLWTIYNGPCVPPFTQDTVNVTVFNPNSPPANAGPDQQVCATSASLAGNTPISPATGHWTLVSGAGSITAPNSPASGVTGLGVGANVFQWTVNNGPCANGLTSDQATITRFDPAAPIANAGPDQSVCSSSPTATMAGSTPTAPSTGAWTVVSGTGTITTPTSPTSTVTNLAIGTVTLRWTISNGPCGAPSTDLVVITIYDQNAATANAGPDQTKCTPNINTTLAGNSPTPPSTGVWILISGSGTITSPSSATSGVTALGTGVNVFRWTINNGPCANPISTDDVTITVNSNGAAIANAGADQNVCSTTPSATLTGSAVTAPTTGAWTLVSGSGTIASPNTSSTGVSGMGVGNNIFQWTVNNGACGNTNDQVSVFVYDANNPPANAGPDQSLCTPNTTATMAGSNVIFPATGTWTLTGGSGTITTPFSRTTTITALGVGANTFRWTVNNGPCGGITTDDVVINLYNANAPVASAGPDQSICSTTPTVLMSGSPTVGVAIGTWTLISGSGTITAAASPFTSITNLGVGNNVFQWSVNNGPCGTTSDQVSVFVFDVNNPVANAGPDQNQCTPFTTATMAGSNVIFPATGTWTLVGGSGTIAAVNSPTTSISNLGVGANVFRWTVINGPCGAATNDLVTINIFDQNAQPANAGADQSVCSTSPVATVTGNAPIGSATGSWTLISGTGTITSPNATTTTLTGLGVGTVIVQWNINNGSCGTSSDQVSILVFSNANPVANAGPDQNLCTPTTSTTLAGSNVIAPAVGTWTVVQGAGVFANANLRNTAVSGLIVGENIFRWTVNNGPCASGITNDVVSIFLFDANNPVANAGPDQSLCRPDTSTNMAGSSLIFPATGDWTLVSGSGTIVAHGSPTTLITGLGIGDNIFRWTVSNGPCGAVTTDDVLIKVYDNRQDVAFAGPDQSICVPTFPNTVTLSGLPVIYPAIGTWTLVSGIGIITSPNNFTTTVTGLDVGTSVFQWTIDNGPCVNPITSDQVSVFVFDAANPAANAGPDQNLCTPITSTVMAGSPLTSPATGTWALVSGSGTIITASDPNSQITGLGLGANVFSWMVNNGPCVPGTTTDNVTINVFNGAAQAANAGADQNLCSDAASTTLAGNAPTFPATGSWTVQQGTATFGNATSATSSVSGLGVGANILVWNINNGACGVSSDPMTIYVYDAGQSAADAGADQSACSDNGVAQVTLNGSATIFPGQGVWTVISGTGNFSDANDPNTLAFGIPIGVNVFQWTVDNGPCAPGVTSDQVTITVYDPNSPVANAGNEQSVCTPVALLLLNGNTPTFPATGLWTIVQGTGTITNPTNPNTTVSGISPGVYIFQWTLNNGPCANPISSDQVTISVYDLNNPVANAGPNEDLCTPTTSTTLNGSSLIFPATGVWTVTQGTGVFQDANAPNTTVNGLSVGQNTFVWSVDNGPCANAFTTDQVSIFLYDANTPDADAGPTQNLCGTTTTVMQASTLIFPATGSWSTVSGTGTFSDPTLPNSTVSNLSIGANVFAWFVNNGPCGTGFTSDQVTINVFDDNAPNADAGSDQSVCGIGSNVQLQGNAPTGVSTGFWSVVSGTVTLSDPADPNATANGFAVGEVVLQWTLDNGTCGSSSDLVSIFVYDAQQAVANAGSDQDLCLPTNTATLSGSNYSFPSTGTWTLVSGNGTISDPTAANSTVIDLGVGANVFLWTVDNGPCGGITTDQVTINIYDNAAASADAGPDQQLCTPTTSATLAANSTVGVAVGTWTVLQGGGTFADANDPNTTVSGLTVGENILQWSISNGPCGSSTDAVSIFLFDNGNADANAGPDQELCTPTASTALAGSSVIFPAQGTWTLVQGTGTFADANDPNTSVSGLTVGENIFQWSVNNGPCANGTTTDQMSVFVYDANNAAADAGPDQQICTPVSTTNLAGNTPTFPASGTWTLAGGTGIIADANDPNTAVSGLTVGENIFVWTVSNGPCANGITTDQVSIFVFDDLNPVADAGPDQELCTPNTSTTLAGSNATFPAQGTWTVLQGTGIFSDPNDPNATVSALTIGENILQWSMANGPCANPLTTDVVSIFVFDVNNPVANAGPDQNLCTPTTSTSFAGSAITFPAQGTWTLVSGAGAIADANDPNSSVTGLDVGANVFAWTVSNGPCANGLTSDTVTILLFDNNNVGANAGADQQFCTPTSTTNLQGSAVTFPASGSWTLIGGTGNIADPSDPNSAVDGLTIGENIFQWTVDNGPCGAPTTDQVSIFIFDDQNPVANAGPDQQLCTPTSDAVLSGSPITFPATGAWTLFSGTGNVANASDPNSAVSGLTVGENIFVWTVSNGPCANPLTSDTMSIFLFDATNPVADAGPDQSLCTPTTSAQLTGSNVIFPAIGTWTILQGNGAFADANDPNTTISGLTVGETIIRWTVNNGPCESGISTDQLSIFLYDDQNPVADAGPDQELCTPNTNTTMAGSAITFPATGTWTLVTGTGDIADPSVPNTAITNLTIGENIFLWTVSNGPCNNPLTTDLVSIFVYDVNNPVADAGTDQQICTPVTSATLAGSSYTFPATGTWTLASGQGTITDPSDPNTTVTDLGIGVNVFTWTVSNGPCANGLTSDDASILLFDLNSPPAAAGPDQSQCTPNTSTTMAANNATAPGTGVWSVAQGSANFIDPASPTTDVDGLIVGENILVWTLENGVCGISHDSVSVFIYDEFNPPANAGPDVEICTPQDSIYLAGNTPTFPAEGTWSLVSGAGLFADTHDPGSKVVGLTIGYNTFAWTVNNGPCNNPITSDTMTVILFSDSTSAPNAGPDLETCLPQTTIHLQGVAPQLPATGIWSLASGSGTIVDPLDTATLITDLTVGISTFVWTLDLGPCPNNGLLTDTMLVYTYDPTAPAADAGPDQEHCTPDTTTTMQALVPTFPGEGTWTLINGTGVISDIHDPTASITGLTIGNNTFQWLVYNGQCGQGPPSQDTVNIAVFDSTAAPAAAGPDQQFCTPNTTATMAGNPATFPGTGSWTLISGSATITGPSDPQTTATNIAVGDNIFVWTIDNGACGTTTDTVLIQMFDGNAAPAGSGPDQSICIPTQPNTVTMAGNVPTYPASGTWTLVSGTGTIADPNDPNSGITDLDVGVSVFTWTISNGPCGTTSDDLTITIFNAASPNANAGPDVQLCTPTTGTAMAGNAPTAPATGQWTIVTGTGQLADPSSPTTAITGIGVGNLVLAWTINNGPCANGLTSDTIVVSLFDNNAPSAAAGPDQQFCVPANGDAAMTATVPTPPASGAWTIGSGSGTITDPLDPFTTITDISFGENTFLWTIDNGACGSTSDAVIISVFDSSEHPADAGPDQSYCQDTTETQLHAVPLLSNTAIGAWTLIGGSGNIVDPADSATDVTQLALGENIFLWTVVNGVCGTTSDSILVVLTDCAKLTIPDAFSPNGDGVNDTYVIEGLEYYPKNTFQVFNRWGSQVLDRSPYNNNWDGRSEGDMNWGEELPESTYYYVLDLGNGDDMITGYIYLKR